MMSVFIFLRKMGILREKRSVHDQLLNDLILKSSEKIMKFREFICDLNGNLKYSRLDDEFWQMENGNFLSAEHWISPEDFRILKRKWRALSGGKINEFEIDYETVPKKAPRYFKLWMRRVPDSSEIFGLIQDISEFKENELRCRSSLQILETVMESLPGFVFVKNAEDRFRYLAVNRRFQSAVDLPESEIIGHTDLEIFHHDPIAAENFLHGDRVALESGSTLDREEIFKIGHVSRKIRTIKTVIQPPEGPRLLIGIGMEVTRQNMLEEERKLMIRRIEYYSARERFFSQALQLIVRNRGREEILSGILNLIGKSSGAESCSVFRYMGKGYDRGISERLWVRPGGGSWIKPGRTEFDLRKFPGIVEPLKAGQLCIGIPNRTMSQPGIFDDVHYFHSGNGHSTILSGFQIDDVPYGFILLEYNESEPDSEYFRIIQNLSSFYRIACERCRKSEKHVIGK